MEYMKLPYPEVSSYQKRIMASFTYNLTTAGLRKVFF